MSNPVTITLNERQIYELEWLEECYKKVRFPNPKCEEFLVEINKTLSHKIRGELDNKIKQQANLAHTRTRALERAYAHSWSPRREHAHRH